MNMILLGPPGAGKGTQAKQLAERLQLMHISTGDILRQAVSEGTDLGVKAKSYMNKGALVPDAIVIGVIRESLPKEGGFILDGFPRTLEQAHALERMLDQEKTSLDQVINLEVPDKEVVRRVSGRRQCAKGHVFNVFSNPSKTGQRCEVCQAELVQRADDRAETVGKRLEIYKKATHPLIDFYQRQQKLLNVNGAEPREKVAGEIGRLLEASS